MKRGMLSVAVDVDPTERLGPDDMATRREAEHLASAVAAQALRAQRTPASTPGICTNCNAQCHPAAVYCDSDCRQVHEQRLRRCARTGRGG